MPKQKQSSGFTILEVLLVLAIVGIVIGFTIPPYIRFQTRNDLDIATHTAALALRRAQLNARGSLLDNSWSVHFQNGAISVYEGSSFSDSPALYATYSLSSNIRFSGMSDVTYSKMTGYPAAPGTVTLQNVNNETRSVTVNAKGTITLQ